MAVLLVIKRVCSFQESKEATTEEGGINYDVFLEELRLISMCNSNSENLCDPNGKISPFHDQGIPNYVLSKGPFTNYVYRKRWVGSPKTSTFIM